MTQYFTTESLQIRHSLAVTKLTEDASVLKAGSPVNRGALLNRMARNHVTLGMHAFFLHGSQDGLKQHFHVSSKLRVASLEAGGLDVFANRTSFFYALLSDSPEVIQFFADPDPIRQQQGKLQPVQTSYRVHLLQLALRDNFKALACELNIVGKGSGSDDEEREPGLDFYSLLHQRDADGLTRLLTEQAHLWEAKLSRGKEVGDDLHRQYMAFCAMKVKLCWLKGIHVQVEHPLVPMGLMPIRPLPSYDDMYDFLSPRAKHGAPRIIRSLGSWIKGRKK